MTKMIIFTVENWADEFDYPIYSVTTKEKLETLVKKLEENPFSYGDYEFGFGTNEYFEFSSEEFINLLEKAKEISDEELATINKFTPNYLGLDIVSKLEGIWDE